MGQAMRTDVHRRLYKPYVVMLAVYALFLAAASIVDSPADILGGILKIINARSVLLTDYVYVGGAGAALCNSALVGCFAVAMLVFNGVKPNGSTIMALWLTTGFAFFGKNLFNMLPLTFGVFLYSKFRKEPFINYSLASLLSATLSPVVSGVTFSGAFPQPYGLLVGVALGILVGAIFPIISAVSQRVHEGYNLYNMGFAGGLIAMFLTAAFSSFGIVMEPELHWSSGNNVFFSVLLYTIFAAFTALGLIGEGGPAKLKEYPRLLRYSGRLVTDYYLLFGRAVYFNMGLTGAFATTVMLLMGCELNGPTLGGIFTIVGFSAFGKHIRNVAPVILGAVLAARINMWDPTNPGNTVAILFATGLAPISGQFGWLWGVAAGFIHVNTNIHLSALNGGFNLYNNGFAATFTALLLVPIINAVNLKKEDD